MPISPYLKSLREKIGHDVLQIPSAAAIVRDQTGKILLVKTADVWGLPAGAIDLGETPAQAVVREVYEETGLEVVPKNIAGVFGGKDYRYVYANGDAVEYFICVFECEIVGGHLFARDGEVSECAYFSIEEFPELLMHYPKSMFVRDEEKVYYT